MAEHTGAVCVCLTAGLSDALKRLIVATAPSILTLEQVRQAATLHIANLDPPGVPLLDQVDVVKDAMSLFDEIFVGAVASATMAGAALAPVDPPRPRATRRRRRGATIAPAPPSEPA